MKCLQIIEIATNKVEKEFDITGKSESYIDKLEMGLARQLNWDLYRIAFVEKDSYYADVAHIKRRNKHGSTGRKNPTRCTRPYGGV